MSLKVLERRSFSQQQRKTSSESNCHVNNDGKITNNNKDLQENFNKHTRRNFPIMSNGPIDQMEGSTSKKMMTVCSNKFIIFNNIKIKKYFFILII